jgi:hypothetical protein
MSASVVDAEARMVMRISGGLAEQMRRYPAPGSRNTIEALVPRAEKRCNVSSRAGEMTA